MKKILLIDNYDSFTYNLLHLIKSLGYEADVRRNDAITIEEVEAYDKILLSPGPGIPSEAGLLLEIVKQFAPSKSILGVCLGHQAIGEVFGAASWSISGRYIMALLHKINVTCDDLLFKGLDGPLVRSRAISLLGSQSGRISSRIRGDCPGYLRGDHGFAPPEI